MNTNHRKILREKWAILRRDLEPDRLLPHLTTILSEEDIEEIKQLPEDARSRKADKLLDMLPRRGPHAFDAFIDALRKVNQSFLVDHLIANTDLADKSCSRCVKMGEKLEKDVLEMNNKIKEFSEYRKQENQKVQQDLENLKKDLQQSNGQVAEETEKQVQKITSLQEQNQELRNEIEQKRCKINELNTQLTRKNEALKKTHKKLEDERKNRKEVELKLEAVRILHKGKKKAMEEVRELSKKLNKHDESSSRCEKQQRKLNLIASVRDSMREQKQNLDTEVLNLNNRIKEISEDNQQGKLALHKELQILKKERENISPELVAGNEQRKEEKQILQGKNEELN